MGTIITVYNIAVPYNKDDNEEFTRVIGNCIEEIQDKGHYAEVHYSTSVAGDGQFVLFALIVEREVE